MLLSVNEIHTYYGKSHILQGVSIQLKKGELVCLLGRNGVGKTTTLKSIMGIVPPEEGNILLNGEAIGGKQAYEVARLGVGFVPEERRIFGSLSVHENLLLGIKTHKTKIQNEKKWTLDRIYSLFPRLQERQRNKGKYLSGGEQQMLTIARTLMGNPDLILVDEPTEGLAPLIVEDVLKMLCWVRDSGVTILLVEQNFKAAIRIADRFYIMSKGKIVFEGDGSELIQAENVRKNYLEV